MRVQSSYYTLLWSAIAYVCMSVCSLRMCVHTRACVCVCVRALMVHLTLSKCWTTKTLAHCDDFSSCVSLCICVHTYIQGIPIVYYGTEQGYSGGNDPSNRESLWPNFNTNHPIYKVRLQDCICLYTQKQTNKQTNSIACIA